MFSGRPPGKSKVAAVATNRPAAFHGTATLPLYSGRFWTSHASFAGAGVTSLQDSFAHATAFAESTDSSGSASLKSTIRAPIAALVSADVPMAGAPELPEVVDVPIDSELCARMRRHSELRYSLYPHVLSTPNARGLISMAAPDLIDPSAAMMLASAAPRPLALSGRSSLLLVASSAVSAGISGTLSSATPSWVFDPAVVSVAAAPGGGEAAGCACSVLAARTSTSRTRTA